MSSLFKLSIQGIRSFDSERHETIQFGFPLTLICGQNGCGKTTIIECLKYATTGDLPPNSKGGAFVNDPSIASRNSVTAQVKLAFLNANGKSMIATRTMQLTKKKSRTGVYSNTFKTLDGQLAVMEKGEKTTMSSKNAELDSSIPIYLGASRAILDYVIFCHQDDSLWPLSEASLLKKRFDDIFEALKFTRVLDNLKIIKKDMVTDIKLIDQSVQHLKIDRERANRIHEKVTKLSETVEKYNEEISDITIKIEDTEKEAESLFQSNHQFQETLAKHEQLTFSLKSYRDQSDRLKSSLKILPASTEEISTELNDYEKLAEEKLLQVAKLKEEIASYESKIKDLRENFNKVTRIEGSLRSKEAAYQENNDKMKKILHEAQKFHSLDYDETDWEDLKKLGKIYLDIKGDLESLQETFQQVSKQNKSFEESKEEALREILQSKTREEEHKLHCERELSRLKEKAKTLEIQSEINHNNVNTLELEKAELENLKRKFLERKSSLNLEELQTKINLESSKINSMELEIEDLNSKAAISSKQSDTHAKISLINEDIANKTRVINRIKSDIEQEFHAITGCDLKEKDCDSILEDKIVTTERQYKEETEKADTARKNIESINLLLKTKTSTLEDQKRMLDVHRHKILKEVNEDEIEEYEKLITDLETNCQLTMEALNTFEVSRQFKIKAIKIAEDLNNCALCLRSFDSPGLKQFVQFLKEDIEKMDAAELAQNVESTKEELQKVKSLNLDVLELRKLESSTKIISKEISKLSSDRERADLDKSNQSKTLEVIEVKVRKAKSLKSTLSEMGRLIKETEDSQRQVDVLKKDLKEYGGLELSSEEIQELLNRKSVELKQLRKQLSSSNDLKFLHQKDISKMETNIKDKELSISNLERSVLNITNIKLSLLEIQGEVQSLETKLSDLELSLKKLRDSEDKKRTDYELTKTQNRQKEEEESVRISKNESLFKTVELTYNAIKLFVEHDLPQLGGVEVEIKELESRIKSLEKQKGDVEKNIKSIEKLIGESSNIKSNLRDNLEYRHLQEEIFNVESQLEGLNIRDAQVKKDEYQEYSKQLRQSLSKLNAEHAGKVGEIRQMNDQILSLKSELMNEYKDVDKKYHEEWIKLQTNMLVSNDIQTYSKALDNAIMKYHSIKMEDINRILRELWNQTYRGTDVDSIAIKSDVNMQAKGNRSYNYRVVMYKQGSELDMRGRCSAGQKVLTSILIRLALAECFGANCGMIALDEPTTNLDLENAEALAVALNRIIEFRKKQKNFQLIVITHDEKFLSSIKGDEFTDHFYRVQRDELQKSIIRRLPINLIQED